MRKHLVLLSFLLFASMAAQARDVININEGWGFKKGTMAVWGVFPNIMIPKPEKTVNLLTLTTMRTS